MLRKLSASRLNVSSSSDSSSASHPKESASACKVLKCSETLKKVAKSTRNTACSHSQLSSALVEWSEAEDNSALKDINRQTAELMLIWSDVQRDFAENLEAIAQNLQKLNESDQRLAERRKHLTHLVVSERKLSNSIDREAKRPFPLSTKKGGDLRLLREQLSKLGRTREAAERQLDDGKAEEQVVKMFRYRQSMQSLSDAYALVASQCNTIFLAQRELCELVPAVTTQDVRAMTYDGAGLSSAQVQRVRQTLLADTDGRRANRDANRRRSAPAGFLHACRQSFRLRSSAAAAARRQTHSTDEQPTQQQQQSLSPPPAYNQVVSTCSTCHQQIASPLYPVLRPTAPPLSPSHSQPLIRSMPNSP